MNKAKSHIKKYAFVYIIVTAVTVAGGVKALFSRLTDIKTTLSNKAGV